MKHLFTIGILAALLLTSCGGGNEEAGVDIIKNPNSAEGYDNSEKMPKIVFETYMHDFGQLMAGETISYSFKFTNTGNADLIISGCDASCGCTVAEYPKDFIAPGASGEIKVTYDGSNKMPARFKKSIQIFTNSKEEMTRIFIVGDMTDVPVSKKSK